MDNNGNPNGGATNNRLFLNFQGGDRFFGQGDRAAYPTTPSTFPQPVFPAGQAQQSPNIQGQGYAPSNLAPQGYFMNNPYPPQYPQQAAQPQYPAAQRGLAPGGYASQQQYADPTNGLAHQLSHQNLGGAARGSPYGSRQPSPSQRPRTAGVPGQKQSFNGYQNGPMPSSPSVRQLPEFQPPPERSPERYSLKAQNNHKRCNQMAADFFKDTVSRARERNKRQSELAENLQDPAISSKKKEVLWANSGKQEGRYLRFLRTRDKPEHYQTIKIIGRGAFGEVKLVSHKHDKKIYAMKSLIKTEMFKKDQLAHVRAERDILAQADSPWVVKLFTTFQDSNFLYMLTEFLPGGDLMTMLIKYEIFSEDITRFYIAEIVLAVEAVHKLGFIHRDIKPDNILLDAGGHVKLTDFGLSTGFHKLHDNSYYQQLMQKQPTSKARDRQSVNLDQINLTVSNRHTINDWRKSRRIMAYSTVGTPDYIAPEIFTGNGYSFDCDWWSVGTIMFECQVGWPPFCAEEAHDTYRKIVNWRQTLHFPDDIRLSHDAEHLIRSLICESENRLGRVSADEIKNHHFFRGVDFTALRSIQAPFMPRLNSSTDTQYFPIDEIEQTDMATRLRATQQSQPQNDNDDLDMPFIGYTFKRYESNYKTGG